MKKNTSTSIKKFLKFNGKNVYFLSVDGTWWIAIKPICEALGVHYEHQRTSLKNDPILGQLPCVHRVVAADGRLRKMVCLPEFFIYGWIFQLRSESPELKEYQWKCYEILHNHFHGALTERNSLLRSKTKAEIEIERLETELEKTVPYQKIKALREEMKKANKSLRSLDKKAVSEQLDLWNDLN